MGDRTGIEWTDATWNPLRGCSRVSKGCRNCYAEQVAARFSGPGQPYEGLASRSPDRWTGEVRLIEQHLTDPLRWTRPRRIFVNSMSDLFHESVPDEWIDRVFAVMALAPQHTFQILTKRPERMRKYLRTAGRGARIETAAAKTWLNCRLCVAGFNRATWPIPNVWLGVSVEDEETADARIPVLVETPAAVRFVSYEPALRSIPWKAHLMPALDGETGEQFSRGIDWIIVGGESGGRHARACNVAWVLSTIRACRAARVACFVKQLGTVSGCDLETWDRLEPELVELLGRRLERDCRITDKWMRLPFRDRKGGDITEWPAEFRVRQFPREVAHGRA